MLWKCTRLVGVFGCLLGMIIVVHMCKGRYRHETERLVKTWPDVRGKRLTAFASSNTQHTTKPRACPERMQTLRLSVLSGFLTSLQSTVRERYCRKD